MAKKVIEEKDVELNEVTPEVEQTAIGVAEEPHAKKAPEAIVPEIKVSKTKEKLVEIHTTEAVDANIGGNRYVFRKNTDQKVPVDVAAILSNSKKAYRK